MHLRTKFSLLLSCWVLLAVLVTTAMLCRLYVSDEEALLRDLQSTLVLFSRESLAGRLDLLHLQIEAVQDADSAQFVQALRKIEGVLEAEVWRDGASLGRAERGASPAPPPGKSRWSLVESPLPPGRSAVRWIGRYPDRAVVLDLSEAWLSGTLHFPHGASVSLVLAGGSTIAAHGPTDAAAAHGTKLGSADLLDRLFRGPAEMAQTRSYRAADGKAFIGTFLVTSNDPPFLIAATTPQSAVDNVVWRTYAKSSILAGGLLLVALLSGMLFSRSLTNPLHALVEHARTIAKGDFEARVPVDSARRDEVGELAGAFREMGHELESLRSEVRRKERLAALGQFSAAIAHEIRNPLGSILGNAQIAKAELADMAREMAELKREAARTPPEPDPDTDAGVSEDSVSPRETAVTYATRALEFVESETLRANRIVSGLMKFARKEKIPEARIDCAERVRKSMEMILPSVESGDIAWNFDVSETPLFCIADEDQIHELLANLVQNAVHATREAEVKSIEISMRRQGELAILTVRDSGHGMTEQTKEHIFEPFFTTKKLGEGTGLGLAIVHGIVQVHRGRIDVHSVVGRGTEIVVSLPLAETGASRNAEERSAA